MGLDIRQPRTDELAAVRDLMIAVMERDYGYPYRDAWHGDVDDLQGFYLDDPRHLLLIAEDLGSGTVGGTAGVRTLRITAPPHPASIIARYVAPRTAELTRVFVLPAWRGQGVGRALAEACLRWVSARDDYDLVQFHSRTAVEFWRAVGATEILDARTGEGGRTGGQVYFELPKLTE